MHENKIALIAWHIGLSMENLLLDPSKPIEPTEVVREINENIDSSKLDSGLKVSVDEVNEVMNLLVQIGLLSPR